MIVRPLEIPDLREIAPKRWADERGFFSEVWNADRLAEHGIGVQFVQDNHSLSRPVGVLRGLHLQVPPFAQAKLVRVARGAIFDVAVDVRRGSPTFGKWVSLILSAEKWNQLLVPVGFAHGFVTIEPDTEVIYKVSAPYSPEHERSIRFDDPALGIEWPRDAAPFLLSDKDRDAPGLAALGDVFTYGEAA